MRIDDASGGGLRQRLRQAREDAGLTQQQVADWLGILRQDVGEMESGTRALKSVELAKLVALYGRTLFWFARGETVPRDLLAAAPFHPGDPVDAVRLRKAMRTARQRQLLTWLETTLGDDWRGRAQSRAHAHDLALAGYAKGLIGLVGVADIFGLQQHEMHQRLRAWGVYQEFDSNDALIGSPY